MKLLAVLLAFGLVGASFASAMLTSMVDKMEQSFLQMIMLKPAIRASADSTETIPKLAESLGMHKFVEYLTKAELTEKLESKGPFTVFAPTDEVYTREWDVLARYFKNETILKAIMKYSVVPEELKVSEIKNDMMVPTLLGENFKIRFNKYKGDKIITASGRIMTLPGKNAKNGKLIEMKSVVMPPPGPITTLFTCPEFVNFTKVIQLGGLQDMLRDQGPFTVFAPNDKAFAKIPEATLDALLKNATALKEILLYHVMKGTCYSAAWGNNEKITMLSGKEATVTIENDKYMINTIPIFAPDASFTNGVVHAIESVLMPPSTLVKLVFNP